ncbi:MAG: bifunctional metallophosphatase/5'-nucleotidase [Clostridiales bacterium]|nr:bifunctional metallophosphatase/5'-nucleotidase [Clostridiales bacterium]
MRKFLSTMLALVMTLALLVPSAWAGTAPKSNDVVVLYTNDVHCQVDQATDAKDTSKITNIGYAGVAAYKKEMQAQYNNVLLVDAGDHSQGGPIGTLSKGSYLIDIMNETGYDYATLGNHEFDYGMDQLLKVNIPKATFQYLSCNFSDASGNAVTKAYDIKTYNGVKVAFIGISTPESFTKSTPTYFQDKNGNYIYSFAEGNNGQDLYNKVQSTIDAAKAAGATYVVAISHLGTDPASSPWTSKEVIANTTGLNVVLDGHSHSTIASETVNDKNGTAVLLSSTGTKLAAIGKLTMNTTTGAMTTELVTDYATQDAVTMEEIASIEGQFNSQLKQVVAHSDVALTVMTPDGSSRAIRSAETNLGDLCADAYRSELGADIAFVNGGGIRDNIPAGDITYEQIIKVHPFGNMACLVEATGQQIVDALEMSSRAYPNENGGFLQVSGLKYSIDPTVASTVKTSDKGAFISVDGARRVSDVQVLDKTTGTYVPIDLTKTYKLASHNYMLKSGGDGLNMFMNDKVLLDEVKIDNQVLIDYIKDTLNGTVGTEYANLNGQGRITYLNMVMLDQSTLALTVGKTATLTASGHESLLGMAITWTSSDDKVATVDASGVVTAVSAGTAVITASVNGFTATCTVTVTAAAANSSPATGDSGSVVIYTALAVSALLGTGFVVGKKKELF